MKVSELNGKEKYRYEQASLMASSLISEGMIYGMELATYLDNCPIKFKDNEDMENFELMLITLVEKKSRYVKATYMGKTYKISSTGVLAKKINCPNSTLVMATSRRGSLKGCMKLEYARWTVKELSEGVKYDDKVFIPYNYIGSNNRKPKSGKYLDSQVTIFDCETGILRTYETGRKLCDVFKIQYGTLSRYIKDNVKYKRRYEINLKELY